MSSRIRVLIIFVFFAILTVPYFNCSNGPNTNGLFNGASQCNDPTKPPATCNGNPALVRFGQLPTSYPTPSTGGIFSFSGQCIDGGYAKAAVTAAIVYTGNGQLVSPVLGQFSCDGGVFSGQAQVPAAITWTTLTLSLQMTLWVYANVTDVNPTPLPAPVVANVPLTK